MIRCGAGVASTRPDRGPSSTPRSFPCSTGTVRFDHACSRHGPVGQDSPDREVGPARHSRGIDRHDDRLIAQLPGVGDDLVVGVQEPERAAPEGRPSPPQGDQPLELVQQVGVPGLRLVPGERPPVGRVVAAGHADLVAVVDRRGAGIRHLEQRRQPQRRSIAAGQRDEPRHVVAVEQVEHDGRHLKSRPFWI